MIITNLSKKKKAKEINQTKYNFAWCYVDAYVQN